MTTHKEALTRIAAYPFTRAEELSVEQMREIAREALTNHIPDATKMVAQPEQEHVATFDEVWDSIEWDKWRMEPIRELCRMIISKTTPPQRKPLTDKQLNIIGSRWHLNLLGADEKAELFAFARAIEAAHGIKEKNT